MKQLTTPLLLLATAMTTLSSCGLGCLEGNGRETTETRNLASFSRINLEGNYKLVLTRDPSQSVTIATDENLMPHIMMEVNNGELRIYSDEDLCDDVEIAIHMPELSGLFVAGAVEAETTNRFTSPEFTLEVTGATEANLDVEAKSIKTEISGAGEVTYRGKTAEHQVHISGACELEAFELVADKYDIEVSGAAKCQINVLNELHVQASGASEVVYRGNPGVVQKDISGAGNVRKAE